MSSDYYKQMSHAILNNNSEVVVNNYIHKDILELCYPNHGIKFRIKFSAIQITKNIIYKNKFFVNKYYQYKNIKKSNNKKKAKYIFVIIHHKFIRYLAPIYNKLEDTLFVICGDLDKSIDLCNQENYQYELLEQNVKLNEISNKEIVHLTSIYESIKVFIKKINPKKIVIPEGNAPIYELFNLVSKREKTIKTICIQQGWSPVYHNGFRKMNYDIFLTWGDEFSDLLKKYNPQQKFTAVGNHILNFTKTIKEKNSITFFHQGINSIITKNDSDLFFKLAKKLANKYKIFNIVIREHPSNPIDNITKNGLLKYKNIKFMNSSDYTLSEVLEVTKIAISVYSTVLYESLFFDVIPISFNTTSLPCLEPNLAKNNLGIESKEINDLINKINMILSDQDYNKKVLQQILENKRKYFASNGIIAVKNIIREINGISPNSFVCVQ